MKRAAAILLVAAMALSVPAVAAEPMAPIPVAEPPATAAPYLRVLGTAQDGGLPHVACTCERCEAARQDPGARRLVASLALVLPESDRVLLLDATPDLPEQLELLADVRAAPAGRVDRQPVDGIVLTHAHVGHYLGLAFLGFEAVHSRELPLWSTPRMASFLRDNEPWGQLVRLGNVALREVSPGEAVDLGDQVSLRLLPVPHRDELSDTVGLLIRGPRRTVLYVPDTDSWEAWHPPLPAVLAAAGVDVAILDGTFYSLGELPGRSVAQIGHPLMLDTAELLAAQVADGLEVYLTHLNHSNPALTAGSPERQRLQALGLRVLAEGQRIDL
ncbi:MAG TPA: MBL fold metallo-hydrolase [Thermoanaerobaculia bacterium]|nr:MBL fold metallo-hydrolase [Thermoanaerobaculia bacterium]